LADALPGALAVGFLVAMKISLLEIGAFILSCYAYSKGKFHFPQRRVISAYRPLKGWILFACGSPQLAGTTR
jgi:hypothetical protein